MKTNFFNAHHSPIGAFSSLTLGFKGKTGGLGLELGKPADQNFYVGYESVPGHYMALPFFETSEDEAARYDVEKADLIPEEIDPALAVHEAQKSTAQVSSFDTFQRDFDLCTDTFQAGKLSLTLYNQVASVPDPTIATTEEMMEAIVPAIWLELTIDNLGCDHSRRAFIGYSATDPYYALRHLYSENDPNFRGVGQGNLTALCTNDSSVTPAIGFTLETILSQKLEENWTFGLGTTAALIMDVPANTKKTYQFVASFYRSGIATAGMSTAYYYTRYFNDIEAVSQYALNHFDLFCKKCVDGNQLLAQDPLSADQKFMMAHAIRSYYGSTQFLLKDNEPIWVVNEGEYRMMNTFDLTVDQLFYEMKFNPWTVKNELDLFTSRYQYEDTVFFPNDPTPYAGGISFTHDMGVTNVFSRPAYSSYEMYGLTGCFSHMTHEQLVNWICCGAVYAEGSGDKAWLEANLPIFEACFTSMLHRDHPEEDKRTGIMKLDSSRVMGGAEITTYDSLDVSLGQSRNNIYLAGKCWAAYVALEKIFIDANLLELSSHASKQALRCANSLTSSITADGYIPAVLENGNTSRIIPAIEGLIFPYFTGCKEALSPTGPYANYLQVLSDHLKTVLVPGTCLFEDHGWKLSSTSNNSWLSKIYLCQFIAHEILELPHDEAAQAADGAHVNWLLHPEESYWAWSDQMISGVAKGSKYYPRGVTSILWLNYR